MADNAAASLEPDAGEPSDAAPSGNALRCLEILEADRRRLGGELPLARVDSLIEKRQLSISERSWLYAELGVEHSSEASKAAGPLDDADGDGSSFESGESSDDGETGGGTIVDPVRYLLKAARNMPLLGAEDERVLGRLVLNGLRLQEAVKAQDVAGTPEVMAAINRSLGAQTKLVLANLRLVASVAHDYRRWTSIDVGDLVQDGIIGLMRAVERFDPEAGFRFSTYASHWIKQSIRRAIDNTGRTIRIPVHMLDTIRKLRKTIRRLEAETQKPPTLGKLADELGWDLATTEEVFALSVMTVVSTDDEGEAENPRPAVIMIDQGPSPQDVLESKELGEILDGLLADLPERDAEIIRRRFGFESEGGQEETLEQIGVDFGLTRERIRQIEARALERLRHPSRSRRLASYKSEQ